MITDIGVAPGNAPTLIHGGSVTIAATVANLDVETNANTTAYGGAAHPEATADTIVDSKAAIAVANHATMIADQGMSIIASGTAIKATANAYADAEVLIPLGIDDETSLTGTIVNDISVAAGVEVDAQNLAVRADAPALPVLSSVASWNDWYDSDSYDSDNVVNNLPYNRTIEWNATTSILGAPDPVLTIDASGTVTQSTSVTTQPIVVGGVTTGLTVKNIVNDPSGAGTVLFEIATATVGGTTALTGTPVLQVFTTFQNVSITNASTLGLTLTGIEPLADAASVSGHLTITVPNNGGAAFPHSMTTGPAKTAIRIANTNTVGGDISPTGKIDDPYGAVSISSAAGSILQAAAGAVVVANTLTIQASGSIGGTAFLAVQDAGILNAAATNGAVGISEQGTLLAGTITSPTLAYLVSSLDIRNNAAASIVNAPTVIVSSGGSIGTNASPLNVDDSGTRVALSAAAGGSAFIRGGAGGLVVSSVTAGNGNVVLSVPDAGSSGQDIVVGAGNRVTAARNPVGANAGNVTLQAGDNVIIAAGGSVGAALGGGTVTMTTDYLTSNLLEVVVATTVDIQGTITGGAVVINTGLGADRIDLTGVNAPTTVNTNGTGATADTVAVGTRAIPASNTGGTLAGIKAAVTINGAGNGIVLLDDTGDGLNVGAVFNNGTITGLGMTGSIIVANMPTVALAVGSGTDTLALQATQIDTETDVQMGSGADAVIAGNAVHLLSGLLGREQIFGGTGTDVLTADDTGDAGATSGTLSAGLLTGFGIGLGSTKTNGLSWSGVGQTTVKLGHGASNLLVSGVASPTMVDDSLATGGTVTVGDPLFRLVNITSPLAVTGAASATLAIDYAGNLTLDAVNPTTGKITGSNVPATISYSGVGTLAVNQEVAGRALTINATTAKAVANETIGGGTVTINEVQNATTVNLSGGGNLLTVFDAKAPVSVTGGASDTLTLDLSGATTAVNNGTIAANGATSAIIQNVLPAAVTFTNLGTVNVLLGSGNDNVTVAEVLTTTLVKLQGNDGNDAFTVVSDGSAALAVNGGTGLDSVRLAIPGPGLPIANSFTNLTASVETLIVDDTASTMATYWVRNDNQALTAQTFTAGVTSGAVLQVVNTSFADSTQILGGTTGDKLDQMSSFQAGVNGVINGNTISLTTGLQIANTASFATDANLVNAIEFNVLGTAVTSYTDGGPITLSTGNAAGFQRIDQTSNPGITSIAAGARAAGDIFTLGDVNGAPFSLFSLSLAALNANAPGQLTFDFTTINGVGGTATITVPQFGAGFLNDVLPVPLTGLTSVAFIPGTGIAVDNIVASELLTPVAAATLPTVPTYEFQNLSASFPGFQTLLIFNSNDGTVTTTYIDPNGNTAASWDFILLENGAYIPSGTKFGTLGANHTMNFNFPGNVVFDAGVLIKATGTNAISLNVTNNVIIGADVNFDVGAKGNVSGGAGGGIGGNAGTLVGGHGYGGSSYAGGGGGGGGGGAPATVYGGYSGGHGGTGGLRPTIGVAVAAPARAAAPAVRVSTTAPLPPRGPAEQVGQPRPRSARLDRVSAETRERPALIAASTMTAAMAATAATGPRAGQAWRAILATLGPYQMRDRLPSPGLYWSAAAAVPAAVPAAAEAAVPGAPAVVAVVVVAAARKAASSESSTARSGAAAVMAAKAAMAAPERPGPTAATAAAVARAAPEAAHSGSPPWVRSAMRQPSRRTISLRMAAQACPPVAA